MSCRRTHRIINLQFIIFHVISFLHDNCVEEDHTSAGNPKGNTTRQQTIRLIYNKCTMITLMIQALDDQRMLWSCIQISENRYGRDEQTDQPNTGDHDPHTPRFKGIFGLVIEAVFIRNAQVEIHGQQE